jgi:hypothetical protein
MHCALLLLPDGGVERNGRVAAARAGLDLVPGIADIRTIKRTGERAKRWNS